MVALVLTACAIFFGHFPLQTLSLKVNPGTAATEGEAQWPFLVPLNKESIPVMRNNVTVSHKTSYSGMISIGNPAQEFSVVFDTGSAHIVVPSIECKAETCQEHRQYSIKKSPNAVAINVDGTSVPEGKLCDQVDIGYGTGMVTGEFVREQVCLGSHSNQSSGACIEVNMVMAVEMTAQPFRSFNFDGVFGLALDSLAMTPEFSFFNSLASSGTSARQQFGVFLTDGEGHERSEIALGGYNENKLLTPLQWAPVTMPKLGYWQVAITEVRINGTVLPVCMNGTCRGIVDSGTSHLGIPGPALDDVLDRLSVETRTAPKDCRSMAGFDLEIVIDGNITLTLPPANYMRPLPAPLLSNEDRKNSPMVKTGAGSNFLSKHQQDDPHVCVPRVMPVDFPAPLGPNLFILGETVMQKYYTAYDWAEKRVGFAISATDHNKKELEESNIPNDYTVLVQVTLKVKIRGIRGPQRLANL